MDESLRSMARAVRRAHIECDCLYRQRRSDSRRKELLKRWRHYSSVKLAEVTNMEVVGSSSHRQSRINVTGLAFVACRSSFVPLYVIHTAIPAYAVCKFREVRPWAVRVVASVAKIHIGPAHLCKAVYN